jgi:excisionase family DNA binding protein
MRYRFRLTRLQTAERSIRATDEESALKKLRSELREPYALLGGWQQSGEVEIELLDAEDTIYGSPLPVDQNGPLLFSIKDAAAQLGISRGTMYELVNRGEIESISLGRRRLVPRAKLAEFVENRVSEGGR